MEARQPLENYTLDLHKHVRIWFSTNPDVFLNQENQLRLVRFRAQNPTDSISLIYAKQLLSDSAHSELLAFCSKHAIKPIELSSLKADLANETEKELMSYVEAEIEHMKNHTGGNPASASDTLRWLIYPLDSIYSDFDTTINTQGLPPTIQTQAPIILCMGSGMMPAPNPTVLLCNNDIIGMPRPNSSAAAALQKEKISLMQNEILNNYRQRDLTFTKLDSRYKDVGGLSLTSFCSLENTEICGETIFALRQRIDEIFATDESFVVFAIKELLRERPDLNPILHESLHCSFTEAVENKQFSLLKSFYIEQIKQLLQGVGITVIVPDHELLDQMRRKGETTFYKSTVINHSCGNIFFATVRKWEEKIDDLLPYSWEGNALDQHFKSGQAIKFNSSIEKVVALMSSKAGDVCDASWLKEGKKLVKHREETMHKSAALIQMWYRKQSQKRQKATQTMQPENIPTTPRLS